MGAITVRQVPEPVHDWLRHQAKSRQMSVESLCRAMFAEAMKASTLGNGPPQSFAESASAYTVPEKSMAREKLTELWGALKDSVHIPDGNTFLVPLMESWKAEA